MKKIISLICIAALLCAVVSSCAKSGGKKAGFVKMNADAVSFASMVTGGEKDIDSEEYYEKIAKAYNSVTETGDYKTGDGVETIWCINAASQPEGETPTIFTLTYVGGDVINVMINGAATKGSNVIKYSVVNPELVKLAEDELRGYAAVKVNVNVTFVVAAGVPGADGTPSTEPVTLSTGGHVVTGTDAKRPTAALAVSTALFDDYEEDRFELSSSGDRPIRIEDYEEKYLPHDESVELYRWKISVNGEALDSGEASSFIVEEGDEVTAAFCYDFVSSSD
ncbi:MAG: hypothetical protein IJT70_06185 [Clostridia bacterium]|nr:hypothetical protein [Clostridia bacterium]